jgi:hypothetical protein
VYLPGNWPLTFHAISGQLIVKNIHRHHVESVPGEFTHASMAASLDVFKASSTSMASG